MFFNWFRFKLFYHFGIICFMTILYIQNTVAGMAVLPKANPHNLKIYVNAIIGDSEIYRNHKNIIELNRVASWLKIQMKQFGIPCKDQAYNVDRQTYKNVVCTLNVGQTEKIIVGAHYDVYGDQEGADDNASGVAGVLEIARLLVQQKSQLKQNIEFVFYTLEEPPYFKTENMGSFIHAKSVVKDKDKILGVYVLEMIGYYSNKLSVQTYPTGLGLIYPKHANFIAAIGNFSSRSLSTDFCDSMDTLNKLQCEQLIGLTFIQGVDFSDHANYWKFGIPAIMITDTAFFRNRNYHTAGDTVATLNFNKMADVVNGLVKILLNET